MTGGSDDDGSVSNDLSYMDVGNPDRGHRLLLWSKDSSSRYHFLEDRYTITRGEKK